MKNSLLMMTLVLILSSCAKEEFVTNKGTQNGAVNALGSNSAKLCAQSTLISPQVDILMLWDNSSSFNFVTPATKSSMSSLISTVSENFDYHIISAPLIPTSSANLADTQLVVKNNVGLNSEAINIVKSKEAAVAGLGFPQSNGGSAEAGVDRAISFIENNRNNGIFRNGAYTMIVVISNEDDKKCSIENGFNCAPADYDNYIAPRVKKLLCMRGNTYENCTGTGYSAGNAINSTMMRFMNISPLTSCVAKSGSNVVNQVYRRMAKKIYDAPYSNGWPTSNDHISALFNSQDSYDLCTIDFSHIFDSINAAIKQTLLKHKYDYWPVASSTASVDPTTLRVIKTDGTILANRTWDSNPTDGYVFVGNRTAQPTRYFPSSGEAYTGQLIQLLGVDGKDKLIYPDCLTVTYKGKKSTYGYIYLKYGKPNVPSIKVYFNGSTTPVPESTTNGWSYAGLKLTSALIQEDPEFNAVDLAGESSGYFLKLNGSYIINNATSTSVRVDYNSEGQ